MSAAATAALAEDLTTLPLYRLIEERELVDAWLEASEGELTPELEQRLDALNESIESKVERAGLFLRWIELQEEAARKEAKRLEQRAIRWWQKGEGLRAYLQPLMERRDIRKVEGPRLTIWIQKHPPSVVCADPSAVHAGDLGDLFVERVEVPATVSFRLRRDRVLAEWKDGKPLPVGVTVDQGTSLRYR